MSEIGALSLRIQETGGQAVVDRLNAIDEAGGDASEALDEITVAMKGVAASGKAIGSAVGEVAKWTGTQQELKKEIAEGTRLFQLQAKTVDVTSKTAVAELRSSAAAQREWLKQIGASTQEQLKFGAAVQQFERKVTAAEVAQRRMAQQTGKQSQATQALNGQLVNANGQVTAFGKAGLRALNGLAFAFSQMAEQGEASLRSLAGQMTSVLSLLGKRGAILSIGSTVGLAVFDVIRASQKRAIDRTALERRTAIRNALTEQKAFLDLTEAAARAGYDQGIQSLRAFYDERERIIDARTKAEIASREQQAAALEDEAAARLKFVQVAGKNLPDALRADTLKQTDELQAQARTLRAEAKALADQGRAETLRNTSERLAAEKQLADQVRQFEAQRLDAQGKTHQARLAAIQAEAAEYDKALTRQEVAEGERRARVEAFTLAMTQQANLAQAQADLSRLQATLETERARIQADVAAGRLTELEAAQAVADVEHSALPTLTAMVERALQFAAALGDEGAVAALRKLKLEMDGLGQNSILDGIIARGASADAGATVRASVQRILDEAAQAGFTITPKVKLQWEMQMEAASAVDQQFQALGGNIANIIGSAISTGFAGGDVGKVVLQGLGTILTQMGQALLTAGLTMVKLLPAMQNPITGGPAMIAAGATLLAIGGLLGGIATGKRGGSGAGAASVASAPASASETRIAVGDGRGGTSVARGVATAATPAKPVNVYLGVWDKNDPRLQREVADTIRLAVRRGLATT
jgi:hypothetical protein